MTPKSFENKFSNRIPSYNNPIATGNTNALGANSVVAAGFNKLPGVIVDSKPSYIVTATSVIRETTPRTDPYDRTPSY